MLIPYGQCLILQQLIAILMKKQLKQPNKYTHEFLKRKSSDEEEEQVQPDPNKTKQIDKQKYVRKVITKPHEPSAIRLEQINKTFEKLSEKSMKFIDELNINKHLLQALVTLKEKFKCECKRNVKYYCLKCNQKCSLLDLPLIKLPLNVHIIHHISEKINKSSVVPMRFLTQDIGFYPFHGKESNSDKLNQLQLFEKLPKPEPQTYILYPHKNSKPLTEVKGEIRNLIVLDCTWFQTDQIIEQMQSKGYKNYIKLEGYESVFWRYNHFGEEALSSAESLMFFFREYQTQNNQQQKRYDQLMLLYALSMQKVEKSMEQ